MRAGACNKWVTLARWPETDTEARGTPLSPEGIWAAIEPLAPGGADNRTITHTVRMRFHPEVTLDTRVAYADARINRTRHLFVRGVQAVNEAGDEMVLLAEEVQP
jgi:Bacteriophage head-tail adaptor